MASTAETSTVDAGTPQPSTARPPHAHDRRVRRLAAAGVAGVIAFGGLVLALHVLDTDLTPHDHFISEYALGGYGALMRTAFLLLGAGVLALALALRTALPRSRAAVWGVGLLVVAAAGLAASAAFDTDPIALVEGGGDPTTHGMLHDLAGVAAFSSTIAAAFVLSRAFASDPGWRPLTPVAVWFGGALLALLIALLATPAAAVGVAQRPFVVVLLVWFGVLGAWARRRTADPAPPEGQEGATTRRRALVVLGVAGPATFAGAAYATTFTEPGLSMSQNFVSDYALGRGGLLISLGFVLLGAGLVAVALGLRRTLVPSRRRTYAVVVLVIAGVHSAVNGILPSLLWTPVGGEPPGWHSAVHDFSGLLLMPFLIATQFVLRGAYARDPRWRPAAGLQLLFAVSFVVLLVAFMASPEAQTGTAQRAHQAVIFTWLSTTALLTGSLGGPIGRPAPVSPRLAARR